MSHGSKKRGQKCLILEWESRRHWEIYFKKEKKNKEGCSRVNTLGKLCNF